MVGSNRIALVVSLVCLNGVACYGGTDKGSDVVSARNAGYNAEVLNGPVLQGPVLQGPVLQGLILNGPVLQGPVLQGPVLQGPVLQGPVLQGPVLQGINLNGPVLQGPVLQGPVLQGPVLQGTLFTGTYLDPDGIEREIPDDHRAFIGSEWEVNVGQVVDGEVVNEIYTLRFDNIEQSDEPEGADDVYLYYITHRSHSDPNGEWRPLCADEEGEIVPAIPLQNYWNLETGDRIDDPNVITFACTNAVLAKCVLWGYRPWATANRCKNYEKQKNCKDMSLQDYHQACTRMARADYCGTGEPWTVANHAIDLWDHLNPQIQTPTTEWFIEAEWNPDGAYCLNDIRLEELRESGAYPSCFLNGAGKKKTINDCGSLKNHRALIVSTFEMPEEDDDGQCKGKSKGKGKGKGKNCD